MSLDRQCNLWSVDTGHFYSNRERYLHDINCKYRQERRYLDNKLKLIEESLNKGNIDIKEIIKDGSADVPEEYLDMVQEYLRTYELIVHKREKAKESKNKLLSLLANKVAQNELTNGKDHIRVLREQDLHDVNIISLFESDLTRTIGIKQDELTDALIVVQIYYFDVFKDLSYFGFEFGGEKYRYYSSSAGQIRKKKAVFIKESIWDRIEKTIMCGLTLDKINEKGGNNPNKHLAYMALSNSATDLWEEFDIDKCIVIDDFETEVFGTYDFVDETDYSITRKADKVLIPHTDGAGMILPTVSGKNFMVRMPWVKGLLGVFDYVKFIKENNCSPVIKDIYGKEYDVIEDDIQIIFTKSMFKLYKYYSSWDEYKDNFKRHNCHAGICKVEEDRIKNAKINYQMLQTLIDIKEDEMKVLADKSIEKISNLCSSVENMQEALGISVYNTNPTAWQSAVKLYPSLLDDTYAKDIIRSIKDSLLNKYRSGKLEVYGKYTFLLPDFYAACQYWFGGCKEPEGLLNDGEVYCWLFRKNERLDCLRSPHLFIEHAVRDNVACYSYGDRKDRLREWFTTDAIYTSTHDLISKVLMFDCDGDCSLVVADKTFIEVAERTIKKYDIVPLYYNMRKAESCILNNQTIYAGLNAAFTGGNIGIYSNNISKIWNDEVFISGTDEEKKEAIDCVKQLCCQNNFVID